MKKNPIIYIGHISDCIAKIKNYTKDLDENRFLQEIFCWDTVKARIRSCAEDAL